MRYSDAELRSTMEVALGRSSGLDSSVTDIGQYKEVQIHGELKLEEHVELIMASSALQATEEGVDIVRRVANRCRANYIWIDENQHVPSSSRLLRPAVPG